MILRRKGLIPVSVGMYCTVKESVERSAPVPFNLSAAQYVELREDMANISQKKLLKNKGVSFHDVKLFKIQQESVFKKGLMSAIPVVLNNDKWLIGAKHCLDNNIRFEISKESLNMFTGNVESFIDENSFYARKAIDHFLNIKDL